MRSSLTTAAFALLALALGAPRDARAEASHHQGSNPGQLSPTGLDRLVSEELPALELRGLVSFLTAGGKFDDSGSRVVLAEGSRIWSTALTGFVEYRFKRYWAVSALVGGQLLVIEAPEGTRTVTSLADSVASGRFTVPWRFLSATLMLSVKAPGTYPESEATGPKQFDLEPKVVVAFRETGIPRLSAAVGLGYKVRLSGIADELTPFVLLPVRLSRRWTLSASLTGGVAVGSGLAKDTIAPGLSVGFRPAPRIEIGAAYYRSVYGHNVVEGDIAVISIGLGML